MRAATTEAMLDELCDVAPTSCERLDEIGLESKARADLARTMNERRNDLGRRR